MSTDLTGADLEQLDALAAAHATAGTQIAGRAADLRTRIQAAVATFESTMSRLQQHATTLTTAMTDEIAAVSALAAGVAWTGVNRGAFDSDLRAFDTQVRSGSAAIDSGVSSLRSSVESRFTPVLEEFGLSVVDAGDGVEAATVDLRGAVGRQRSALDEAANVGWMSA